MIRTSVIALLLVFFAASLAQEDDSYDPECSIEARVAPGEVCTDEIACVQGFHCEASVCKRDLAPGATCVDIGRPSDQGPSITCGGGFDCVNARCDVKRFAGEECDASDQCYSQDCDLGNDDDDEGVCRGDNVGAPCNPVSANSCDEGLYCSATTGTCQASARAGGDCSQQVDAEPGAPLHPSNSYLACQPGYVCSQVPGENLGGGVCVEWFALEAGEECVGDFACPLACQVGLAFDPDNSTCVVDCGTNESDTAQCFYECECDQDDDLDLGVCEGGDCHEIFNDAVECLQDNDCYVLPESMFAAAVVPGTCVFERCKEEFDNAQCCLSGNGSLFPLNAPTISCPRFTGDDDEDDDQQSTLVIYQSASASALSMDFVVILVIVGLSFVLF